jgi:hypothetical protein
MSWSVEARGRRDHLLGNGALIVAASSVFNSIGTLLIVLADMSHHAIAGAVVSDWFAFLSPVMTVIGAALLAAGLIGVASLRFRRIHSAGLAVGVGFVGVCVATAVLGGIFAAHHVLGTLTAATIAGSVGGAIAAIAFVGAATAFGPVSTVDGGAGRDARLAAAASIFVVAMVASITSDVLALIAASKLTLSTAGTAATALQVASTVFEFFAAVMVASAFAGAARGVRQGLGDWLPRRDRLLAVAIGTLTFALLLFAAASIVEASQTSALLPSGYKVGRWLGAAGNVIILAGLLSGLLGLLKTGRRAEPVPI